MNRPVPSHHGHLTACDVPPNVEITWPVPRQGVQRCGSCSCSGLKAGAGYPMPGGATEVVVNDSHGPMRNILIEHNNCAVLQSDRNVTRKYLHDFIRQSRGGNINIADRTVNQIVTNAAPYKISFISSLL